MGTQTGGPGGDALDEARRSLRAARSRTDEARRLCELRRARVEQRLIDTEVRISRVLLRAGLVELEREAGGVERDGQP